MPVSSLHPNYHLHAKQVKRCRDCYDGTDAIKAARTTYLPKLVKQDDDDYNAYLNRSLFYGATSRTVTALTGVATYKRPVFSKNNETFKDLPSNVNQIVEACVRNVLVANRHILLVDIVDGEVEIVQYNSEALINWFGNTLVLKEEAIVQADDPFEQISKLYYRVLSLKNVDDSDVPVYSVDVFDDDENLIESYIPKVRGKYLTEIPITIITTDGIGVAPNKPPILDLVDVNLSHYRSSADLEHGRHFTALPTPWVSGVTSGDDELLIGTTSAWVLPEAQARAGFLEFKGQGLGSLEKALSSKEAMMASLSARLFEKDSRVSESAETMQTRQNNESGILSNIASVVEIGLSRVLSLYDSWKNSPNIETDTIFVEMSREYMNTPLGPQDIKALVEAYQVGVVSLETLLFNLKKGEKLAPEISPEDEIERLKEQDLPTTEENEK